MPERLWPSLFIGRQGRFVPARYFSPRLDLSHGYARAQTLLALCWPAAAARAYLSSVGGGARTRHAHGGGNSQLPWSHRVARGGENEDVAKLRGAHGMSLILSTSPGRGGGGVAKTMVEGSGIPIIVVGRKTTMLTYGAAVSVEWRGEGRRLTDGASPLAEDERGSSAPSWAAPCGRERIGEGGRVCGLGPVDSGLGREEKGSGPRLSAKGGREKGLSPWDHFVL